MLRRAVFVRHRYPHLLVGEQVPLGRAAAYGARFIPWLIASGTAHAAVLLMVAWLFPVQQWISLSGVGLKLAVSQTAEPVDVSSYAEQRVELLTQEAIEPSVLPPPVALPQAGAAGDLFDPLFTLPVGFSMLQTTSSVRPVAVASSSTEKLELAFPRDFVVRANGWSAASLLNDLATELAGRYHEGGSLSAVLLVDQSASMAGRLAWFRGAFEPALRELSAQSRAVGSLRVGVVGFGARATVWAPPSDDLPRALRALDRLIAEPPDPSGEECTIAAIQHCIHLLGRSPARQKAIVVLTDEAGDDGDELEPALELALRESVSIYVVGREAPLLSSQVMEKVARAGGDGASVVGMADLGADSPRPEAPLIPWGEWQHSELPSGFGPYALSRLAAATGGRFYLAEPGSDSASPTHPGYTARALRRYRPELHSLQEYQKRQRSDALRRSIVRIVEACGKDRLLAEFSPSFPPEQLPKLSARLGAKLQECDRLLAELEAVLPSDAKLTQMPRRRFVAVGDLLRAHLLLARHRLDQLQVAVLYQLRRRVESGRQCVLLAHAGRPVSGPTADRDAAAVLAAFRAIAARHSGTPWSELAGQFLKRSGSELYAWRIDLVPRPAPGTAPPAPSPSIAPTLQPI